MEVVETVGEGARGGLVEKKWKNGAMEEDFGLDVVSCDFLCVS